MTVHGSNYAAENRVGKLLAFQQYRFDQADDHHQHSPTNAAGGNAAEDRADIERSAGRRCDSKHSQQLASQAAAEDPGDRIADQA